MARKRATQGQGGGEGRGETTGEEVAVGYGVAICCTVTMFVCAIPMIIGGAVLLSKRNTYVIRSAFKIIDLLII